MIRYTTTDIIKRAEQLADLENSDFISDYEKLSLLNEAWQMLYQKVINAYDKTWIKKVSAYDGMTLPKDFYQMSALYWNRSLEQIPKKNTAQRSGYELINGKLSLSNDYIDRELTMEYYPIPNTLMLREKTIDAPFANSIYGANHSLYIDDTFAIRDINDDSVFYQLPESYIDYALFDNAAIAVADSDYTQYGYFNYDGNAQINVINVYPVIVNNKLYKYDERQHQILDLSGNIYKNITFNLNGRGKCIYIYTNDNFSSIYYFTRTGYYYNDEPTHIELADRLWKLEWVNNHPYAILRNEHQVVRCDKDSVHLIKNQYIPVTFVSDKYVLTKKPMSSLTYLEGFVEDTVLDFSNNLYFITLSYMLALSFKNKQGSDTSALTVKYEEALTQLFDGLSNDINDYYQIKDVYANKGYLLW